MSNWVVIICCLFYLCLLFGVAYYAEYKQKKRKSIINNPYVYALSLAVYCTAWTYYGSVGQASAKGIEFLAVYIGPTIMAALFWPVLRKIIRICKTQRINSIADLISTRYGKNFSLAIAVTLLCMIGIIPYIALQLKAISVSINILSGTENSPAGLGNIFNDNTFYIALALSFFIILFGTRSIDASEKHEGLVAAIAFESIIKLVAFLAVGLFVTYGLFDGFEDIFSKAANDASLKKLFTFSEHTSYSTWTGLILLSMLAIIFLPRQFQLGVVENVQENHLRKAIWLFPLYLFLITLFVLPIAFGGKLLLGESAVHADTYVLALPMQHGATLLTIFTFIGGFSAATSMIIVETIAISTMMSNNIATPFLLSTQKFKAKGDGQLTTPILNIRRLSILLIIILAFLYDKLVAQHFTLVSIGMVSFAAVAQFAPAVLGGIYWKHASQRGAMASICVGFAVWFYTAVVPSMASAGILDLSIVSNGLFGISWLKPLSLFGMEGMDSITHCFFWSMFFNIITFVAVSLNSKKSAQEIYQAEIFVDIFRHSTTTENNVIWKGTAYLPDLNSLLANFLGTERAEKIIATYAARHHISLENKKADPRLVAFAEKVLSGVIGSASARIMVSSVTKEEELKINEVIHILRESQQMMELNKELRRKSAELQKATDQLTSVNEQLKDIDQMKDEFLYTVTHELRTPLTSIRAMAEIVHDNTDMEEGQRQHFLSGLIRETERLSHLITQVLNLERYESGRQKLNLNNVILNTLIAESIQSVKALINEKGIQIQTSIPDTMFIIRCDADLIQQVMNNLLSNAIKFVENGTGRIKVSVHTNHDEIQVWVEDNGRGIPDELHELVFDKFFQAKNQTLKKPQGTGLGLAICKKIVEMHNGKIWVQSTEETGSRFIFTLPNS
ncbi:MAG: GHKL domain-containing protein [Chitinophagaceae bacterium]|nr:GHKL domain-containing protein [Chitinophagaceae bacterium]